MENHAQKSIHVTERQEEVAPISAEKEAGEDMSVVVKKDLSEEAEDALKVAENLAKRL